MVPFLFLLLFLFIPFERVEAQDWVVCSGHGVWDPDWHGCLCDTGWQLEQREDAPVTFDSQFAATCQKCVGPYGPPIPLQGSDPRVFEPPYCYAHWTPDPIDKHQLRICSGHGEWQNEQCVCHDNVTAGFWELQPYTMTEKTLLLTGEQQYEYIDIEYTVETCIGCQTGVLPPNCLINGTASPTTPTLEPTAHPSVSPTTSPTYSPTTNPTTSPTKSPTTDPTTSPTYSPTTDPTTSPTYSPTTDPTTSPTYSPTTDPTKSPTTDPTTNPTKNPTASPTLPIARIVLYDSGLGNVNGAWGTGGEPATTAICTARASVLGIDSQCRDTVAFTTTNYLVPFDNYISNFPTLYGFDTSTPIQNDAGFQIAATWTDALTTGIDVDLRSVLGIGGTRWWSGSNADGSMSGDSCTGWANNLVGFNGQIGSTTSTTGTWMDDGTTTCDQTAQVVCMCTSTELVTPPILRVVLYDSGLGSVDGDWGVGGIPASSAICASRAATLGIDSQCRDTPAFTTTGYHQISSFPTIYNFDSSTARIENIVGTVIGSNWGVIPTGINLDLQTALGLVDTQFWAGSLPNGDWGASDCFGWITNSGGFSGRTGSTTSTSSGWLAVANPLCSTTAEVVCACTSTEEVPVERVALYALDAATRQGDIGNRATIDAECSAMLPSIEGGDSCRDAFAFIEYAGGIGFADMPTVFGFDTSVPVTNMAGGLIGTTWASAVAGPGSIQYNLNNFVTIPGQFWTGYDGVNTCTDWTDGTAGSNGDNGKAAVTDTGWITGSVLTCDFYRNIMCACTSTTPAPTPRRVVLYESSLGTVAGNLVAKQPLSSVCRVEAVTLGKPYQCAHTFPFIDYTGSDFTNMPTDYDFDTSVPVQNFPGGDIGSSWLDVVVNGGNLDNSLYLMAQIWGRWWSGKSGADCTGWTTNSGAVTGNEGASGTAQSPHWWDINDAVCSDTRRVLCACTSPYFPPIVDRIVLYESNLGTTDGNIGPRPDLNQVCIDTYVANGLEDTCLDAFGFIAYNDVGAGLDNFENMPTIYNFSESIPVENAAGLTIGTSWEDVIVDLADLTNSLFTALGVVGQWWTGKSATDRCNDWQDGTGGFSGRRGLSGAVNQNWWDSGSDTCGNLKRVVCACTAGS